MSGTHWINGFPSARWGVWRVEGEPAGKPLREPSWVAGQGKKIYAPTVFAGGFQRTDPPRFAPR